MLYHNPASAKGVDRYAYAYNNPLYYTDPSGHIPELECGFSHGGCGDNSMAGYDTYQSPDILDEITSTAGYEPGYFEPLMRKFEESEPQNIYEEVSSILGFSDTKYVDPLGVRTIERLDAYDQATYFVYGGSEALQNEALECLTTMTNEECANPFWPDVTAPERVTLDYDQFYFLQTIKNANNLFFVTFMETLNVDDSRTPGINANYDPIWLDALMNVGPGPDIAIGAAYNTLRRYENSVHGADIDFLEWLTSTGVKGPRQ